MHQRIAAARGTSEDNAIQQFVSAAGSLCASARRDECSWIKTPPIPEGNCLETVEGSLWSFGDPEKPGRDGTDLEDSVLALVYKTPHRGTLECCKPFRGNHRRILLRGSQNGAGTGAGAPGCCLRVGRLSLRWGLVSVAGLL